MFIVDDCNQEQRYFVVIMVRNLTIEKEDKKNSHRKKVIKLHVESIRL